MFEELPLNLSISLGFAVLAFAISKMVESVIPYCKSDRDIKLILFISTIFYAVAFLSSIVFIINILYIVGLVWDTKL